MELHPQVEKMSKGHILCLLTALGAQKERPTCNMEFLQQVDKTSKGHNYPHCTYQQSSATYWQLRKHVYVCVCTYV